MGVGCQREACFPSHTPSCDCGKPPCAPPNGCCGCPMGNHSPTPPSAQPIPPSPVGSSVPHLAWSQLPRCSILSSYSTTSITQTRWVATAGAQVVGCGLATVEVSQPSLPMPCSGRSHPSRSRVAHLPHWQAPARSRHGMPSAVMTVVCSALVSVAHTSATQVWPTRVRRASACSSAPPTTRSRDAQCMRTSWQV